MIKVLFVDDEPAVLEGLQDLLHGYRRRWDMTFACGGEAAIAAMKNSQYDVVVSDIRMPGLDGVAVLNFAKNNSPQAMRIALTGFSDEKSTIELTRLAQRYVRKPCSLDDLDEAIVRDCGLISAFDNSVVRELVGRAGRLPADDNCFQTLLDLLDDSNSSIDEIIELVEHDVALTAKVLQLVNSSFFRRQRSIHSAGEAVAYLGADILRSLVLAHMMFNLNEGMPKIAGFNPGSLQNHCILTSTIAREISTDVEVSKIAFTAALLHDVGKFIIARERPDLISVLTSKGSQSVSSWVTPDRERDILGCTHAEVGGCFLNTWGLPTSVVEAVTFHDNPASIFRKEFDVIDIVHVSNYLAHWIDADTVDEQVESKLDLDYLQARIVEGKLDEWKKQTQDICGINQALAS